MSQYHTFDSADAVAYAQRFSGITPPQQLVVGQEVGDGNLNLVFKILDNEGNSRVIVKQALPYVRCVGESWPLTLDRARLEAQILTQHYQYAAEFTVKVTHYDAELAVMVMEDLSDHAILRGELIAGRHYPQAAYQLGQYLAQVHFFSSDFALTSEEKKHQVTRFVNPAMCGITEELFFVDPYQNHPRNNYPQTVAGLVAELQQDQVLKLAVAALKHGFMSHAEGLLHGDIHSGSIFVNDQSFKAIDAEFGFFGPLGFDCGTAVGNLLLNYCGLPGLLAPREAAQAREQRLQDITTLWESYRQRFIGLAQQHANDATLASESYVQVFLSKVWRDTIGYAGTELIRRSVGMSHVADLEEIEDEVMRNTCIAQAITLGRQLVLAADTIESSAELLARIRQVA